MMRSLAATMTSCGRNPGRGCRSLRDHFHHLDSRVGKQIELAHKPPGQERDGHADPQ